MAENYIAPSGTIKLYASVPLSPDHNDVIYIQSESAAVSALDAYPAKTFSEESYTRQGRGKLRVGALADDLLLYNYLSWTNNMPIGQKKYFFAFVTNIEYINNNCSEVSYIIDNYMTWFPFTQLGECFVEREIPASDRIGEHTVDEGIDTGDLVNSFSTTYDFGNDYYYLFQASTDEHGNPRDRYVNGISCPLYYFTMPVGSALQEIVNYYHGINPQGDTQENTNNPDNMISINIIPAFLADQVGSGSGISSDTYHFSREMDIDGYMPKNNKLYTYPYSRINISNNSGTITEYRWELFADPQTQIVDFQIIGTTMGNPSILCYPLLYDNVGAKYDNAIAMTNFPPIPWINDTYKAFIAQNKANIVSTLIGMAGNVAQGAVGMSTAGSIARQSKEGSASQISAAGSAAGSAIGMFTSPVQAALNMVQEVKNHQFAPEGVANLAQSDMIMLLAKRMRFDFYNVTVKREYAKIIDDFFSAFGYAIRRIKTPDIHARAHWSYVKTCGCILNGCIPAQAKNDIINMFDRGIRIWDKINKIGHFELKNSLNGN